MDKKRVALQESSPGWSDSGTPGIGIGIISGIGASDSVAFCTTVDVFERSGKLRSNAIINNIHAPQGCRPALQYLSPNGDPMHRNYGLTR